MCYSLSKNCFFSFRQIQLNGNFGKKKKFFEKSQKRRKNKNFLIENCVIHKNVLYISYYFQKLCYLKIENFIFHLRLKKLLMLYITFFSRVGNNILSRRIVAYIRYPSQSNSFKDSLKDSEFFPRCKKPMLSDCSNH